MDDSAVSPVIAVIMMIAITVVVAGVILVLVQGIGTTVTEPRGLAVLMDQSNDHLRVSGANSLLYWNEYELRSDAPLHWAVNRPATSSDDTVDQEYVPLSGGQVTAGDTIAFCGDDALSDVTVLIRDAHANAVVYQGTFRSVGAC